MTKNSKQIVASNAKPNSRALAEMRDIQETLEKYVNENK